MVVFVDEAGVEDVLVERLRPPDVLDEQRDCTDVPQRQAHRPLVW